MRLLPVSLAIFYRELPDAVLEVWTQVREDDGIYHGLLEFPGGGIEKGETPLAAVVREVEEEVGITVNPADGKLMGIYTNILKEKTILLNVFLFPDYPTLTGRGRWLSIDRNLSQIHSGLIPDPNHKIIDDLYYSLFKIS